jgi:DNA-binding SARP family transcriptional activator/tetratricopeptide (TPR) repeat protein
VWFGVLGPLEVFANGQPVRLHGLRQERLLAVLLLNAERTVTVQELVDVVWEEPPATARRQIQDLVARLRRAFSSAGAPQDTVSRQRAGYQLRLGDSTLDAYLFEHLVAVARDESTVAPAAAVATLRKALGLWRGEPLGGIRNLMLDGAVRVWEERRLAAWEECLALELSLGQHHDVSAELLVLVDRYPFRESLVGLLMLAMKAAGRRSDGLRVYHELRQRMADELGLDPGAELQQLRNELLVAQPGPGPETGGDGPGVGMAPARQLPLDVSGFTGRDSELAQLNAVLAAAERPSAVVISALSGTAGVGKTALALHWAHQVCHRFPDGQLYVNLRGFDPGGSAMSPAEAVRGFLDALQLPAERIPAGLEAQASVYRSLLAGRRMLVLLDNARDAEQIRPLLPGTPGCLVVVTSRNQLSGLVAGEGAHPLNLDLLTVADARELLARRLGPDRVGAEPEAVDEIIARCARLPLALTIMAARAAARPTFPLSTLAAGLREVGGLDAFSGGDPATDVRAVFSWSYRSLSAGAARLFRLLSLHPGPDIAAAAAASLAGVAVRQARQLLAELDRAHLIIEPVPGRYTFHDLLRAYAAELVAGEHTTAEQDAVRYRVFDHYLHTANRAALQIAPYQHRVVLAQAQPGVVAEDLVDAGQATAWFSAECAVLLAVVQQCTRWDFGARIWQLTATLVEFLDRRGRWQDQADSFHTAVEAAYRAGDRVGQANAERGLGWACMRLSRNDDARTHLGHAVALFAELGDQLGEADAHRNLGWLEELQGDYQEALSHDLRSLALYRAVGDQTGQARALGNIGWDYAQLGDHRQALRYCRQALDTHREAGNRRGEAAAWDSSGFAHHHLGDHRQAVDCFDHALGLYRELGDRYNEADTLLHLGDTHQSAGDPDAAREIWQHALRIFSELGHPDAEQVHPRLQSLR